MIYLQAERETLSYFSQCVPNIGKLNVVRRAAGVVNADDTGSWSRLQEVFIHNITQGPFSQEHEIVTTKSALVRKIQVQMVSESCMREWQSWTFKLALTLSSLCTVCDAYPKIETHHLAHAHSFDASSTAYKILLPTLDPAFTLAISGLMVFSLTNNLGLSADKV